MPVATNVDEMIDAALTTARDVAGIPTGATVVLTAGRRTGTPGRHEPDHGPRDPMTAPIAR